MIALLVGSSACSTRHMSAACMAAGRTIVRALAAIALAACLQVDSGAAEPAAESPRACLERARRLAVLGDSITYDGRWVAELAAWMESRSLTAEIINVALPSEHSHIWGLLPELL
jgi:hypothetical protein